MIKISEVKWIKITTDMFEDDKIDFIQTLPEADALIVIWVRLLTLAGKCNAGGYIYLTENIPYDPNLLAFKFRKPVNIINLALETFKRLGMIECDNRGLFISNWEKHQNVDGLDKIREQTKLRVQRHRENKKLLACNVTSNDTSNGEVTDGNAIEIDKEIDKEIDIKEIELDNKKEVDEIWNYYCEKLKKLGRTRKKTEGKIKHIRARINDNFSVEQLKTVIDNVFSNEFMLGKNDQKKMYIEIDNFMCNTEKVEKWLELKQKQETHKPIEDDKCIFCKGKGVVKDLILKQFIDCPKCNGTGKNIGEVENVG